MVRLILAVPARSLVISPRSAAGCFGTPSMQVIHQLSRRECAALIHA